MTKYIAPSTARHIDAKTKTAEQVMQNNLCSYAHASATALNIRREPIKYRNDNELFGCAKTLSETVLIAAARYSHPDIAIKALNAGLLERKLLFLIYFYQIINFTA